MPEHATRTHQFQCRTPMSECRVMTSQRKEPQIYESQKLILPNHSLCTIVDGGVNIGFNLVIASVSFVHTHIPNDYRDCSHQKQCCYSKRDQRLFNLTAQGRVENHYILEQSKK